MDKLPPFFYDDSSSDKSEEVIVYFLAWTLRCAQDEYCQEQPLNTYARKILSKFLYNDKEKIKEYNLLSVKTKREVWHAGCGNYHFDLSVEIEIEENNGIKKYVLIIEAKTGGRIKYDSLKMYKDITDCIYDDAYTKKYILFQAIPENLTKQKISNDISSCSKIGFIYIKWG
jgi:hypothetical protein